MKKLSLGLVLLAFSLPAFGKDVALVLNDREQMQLYRALDMSVRANGISVAPDMVNLLNRLKSAPVVTEQKPATSEVLPAPSDAAPPEPTQDKDTKP